MSVTDSYGDTCVYYDSYPSGCGYFDDNDFIASEACCSCQNDGTEDEDDEDKCEDDLSVTDHAGYGCNFYDYYPEYCGVFDSDTFIANVACCSCAGKGPSNTTCEDTDGTNITDSWGDSCSWYSDYPGACGTYDDSDFIATDLCCGCGGGNVTENNNTCYDNNTSADIDGFSCYAYTLYPEYCGEYDDADFSANE